jgi:hypothetical protein
MPPPGVGGWGLSADVRLFAPGQRDVVRQQLSAGCLLLTAFFSGGGR